MDEKEIRRIWLEFTEAVIKKHHLVPDWQPDFQSIRLWEEFKNENSINKVA